MTLVWRSISPILSAKEYGKRRLRYLTPEIGAKEIEPNIVHHDGKQIKFLLLPDAIPAAACHRLEAALKSADLANCARAANGQKRGKKLTIGWYPQKPIYAKGNGYTNTRTAPTLDQPGLVAALRPMLRAMNDILEKKLPEYHDFALERSLLAWRPEKEKDDLSRVPRRPEELRDSWPEKDLSALSDDEINEQYAQWCATALPDPVAIVENLDPWGATYTLFSTIFSTVEINRNIVFKAHEDGHNVEKTLVGITTLGSFTGGRLVFPRYGYSAELAPRDLLICDNNHELHGNLGPIVGERFSVVAYLYEPLLSRSLEDAWDGGRVNAPTVWDCHNGKNYPVDAVYVGCRVLNRKGEVIREGTIFGNGTNPLVSHKGALNSESEPDMRDTLGRAFVQDKGYEYIPNFLSKDEADALCDFMTTLPWADHQPSCKRVSFGPQMKPIPQPGRTGNINEQKTWPKILLNVKERMEARYDCCFNSIECHFHEDENSKVRAHRDAQPGYIAMVSVGQPRRFTVQKRTRETYLLAHGSLLSFLGRIEHAMPAETHPCKPRISLIFRYNPKGLVESGSKRTAEQKKTDRAEFEKAQAEWRQTQVGVGKQKAAPSG